VKKKGGATKAMHYAFATAGKHQVAKNHNRS
jgi:hypothetical protein